MIDGPTSAEPEGGIVWLSGEIGQGKTRLLRQLEERLRSEGHGCVHVPVPTLDAESLMIWCASRLGRSRSAVPESLFDDDPGELAILVDDAEHLPPDSAALLAEWVARSQSRLRVLCTGTGEPPTALGPITRLSLEADPSRTLAACLEALEESSDTPHETSDVERPVAPEPALQPQEPPASLWTAGGSQSEPKPEPEPPRVAEPEPPVAAEPATTEPAESPAGERLGSPDHEPPSGARFVLVRRYALAAATLVLATALIALLLDRMPEARGPEPPAEERVVTHVEDGPSEDGPRRSLGEGERSDAEEVARAPEAAVLTPPAAVPPPAPEPVAATAPAPEPAPSPEATPEPPPAPPPSPSAPPEPPEPRVAAVAPSLPNPVPAAPAADAEPALPDAAPAKTRVIVNAIPAALITLDGEIAGGTPIAGLEVEPGVYVFGAKFQDGTFVEREVEVSGDVLSLVFP